MISEKGFVVQSHVADDYVPAWPAPRWPQFWRQVPVQDPRDHELVLGFAEFIPHNWDGPFPFQPGAWDPHDNSTAWILCRIQFPDPGEPATEEQQIFRDVIYLVIREDGEVLGLVEYIPPGVVRPERPAPYETAPILASLSW